MLSPRSCRAAPLHLVPWLQLGMAIIRPGCLFCLSKHQTVQGLTLNTNRSNQPFSLPLKILFFFCNLTDRKRYEKAEQEFIAAKLDLHNKTERKDLLTEHLYTIIRENEVRKAKKLEELMAKLNVAADNTTVLKQSCSTPNNDDNKSTNSQTSVLQEEKTPITQNCDGNMALRNAHDSALADKTTSEETIADVNNTAAYKSILEAVAETSVTN